MESLSDTNMTVSSGHLLPIIAESDYNKEHHLTAQDDIDNGIIEAKDVPFDSEFFPSSQFSLVRTKENKTKTVSSLFNLYLVSCGYFLSISLHS